jgi:hypothetical protein
MSANNNREGEGWSSNTWQHTCADGREFFTWLDVCKKCGKARPQAEAAEDQPEHTAPTRTPHATPADVTMLWDAIDQLKARIDALERPE